MIDTWIATKVWNTNEQTGLYGITVDNNGTIYFTVEGNLYQIPKDENNPKLLLHLKGSKLCGIVCNNNILYICDFMKPRILSYSIDTGKLSTLAGCETQGHKDGKLDEAQFYHAHGITMDKDGNLYITQEHCVRKINISEGTVITIAGSAHEGHKDGDAKQAMFNNPAGIAITEENTIYITDWSNNCIREIKNGIVSTIAGIPEQEGLQDGALSDSLFNNPNSLVVNIDGSLIIGDVNWLRRVDLHQQTVSTIQQLLIYSVAIVNQFEMVVGGENCITKLENTWKWKKWVWIGNLKENPNNCLLAKLPRDIIKEITRYL